MFFFFCNVKARRVPKRVGCILKLGFVNREFKRLIKKFITKTRMNKKKNVRTKAKLFVETLLKSTYANSDTGPGNIRIHTTDRGMQPVKRQTDLVKQAAKQTDRQAARQTAKSVS